MGIEESSLSNINTKHEKRRGGFGKVWRVQYKRTKHQFALKEMSKVKIIDRKSEKSIRGERDFLSQLHHSFIVNMICSFQDHDNLYLVMDLLTGGDLRYHICHKRRFSEEQTKFFIACVLIGLEYIHSNNVIHRDIKPENLVCDENGYIALTDFGVAKKNQKDNSSETSGTPGYMAPEVLCALNHSFPVDFFALGVMGYEFMLGVRPYVGKNRKEIKELVLSRQAHIRKKDMPDNWSIEAVDFINVLLQRKPSHRLGYNGIDEVKTHPWFNDFNWEALISKKMTSPFQPKYGDNFDKKYCEGKEQIGTETEERYTYYRKKDKYRTVFDNYTFCRYDTESIEKYSSVNSHSNSNSTHNNTNTSSSLSSKQFSFSKMLNLKNHRGSTNSLQGSSIYQSLQPQSSSSTRSLQTPQPQSHQQPKRFSPNKQQGNQNMIKKQSTIGVGNSGGFLDDNIPFSVRNNKKPLPVLHQNASMKYLNFNGNSLSLYGINGILNKKPHSSSRTIMSTGRVVNSNNNNNNTNSSNSNSNLKYGTTTANSNYNPFLKKSSSMVSIKHYHY